MKKISLFIFKIHDISENTCFSIFFSKCLILNASPIFMQSFFYQSAADPGWPWQKNNFPFMAEIVMK